MTDKNNFIGIYPDCLNAEFCQTLINKFDSDSRTYQGQTGQGVDANKKDSLDLMLDPHQDWHAELSAIHQITLHGLIRYAREYPHFLVGALSLNWTPPGSNQAKEIRAEDITSMDDSLLANFITSVFRLGKTNLQKYNKGSGGYHHWHSEHYPHPHDESNASLHRTLLWMYYLNDVEKGGGTSFYYQNQTISPKTGTLVIAPAGFTHTHKGEIPESNDKYILTSWVMYKTREELYKIK
ncbi:MAG: 2OG-Fe(II) oxygenase [Gammaproteobacteria bacterium]|nr:2OG-Fe(II) oxygenase [Gammaproteobacteria bacterium]NNC97107.1 2OG-Fe(II) oxygenase [Gammaproteobacteria bacterium]NNM14119.1 2OG-Fe(II) oxygenase [Gammaproteobacteria bacterium]